MAPTAPPKARGQARPPLGRSSPRAPVRIGVGVDGGPSGRDAVVLASLLRPCELMLIAVYEEPPPLVPVEMGWTTAQEQAQAMLVETRNVFAPEARTVATPDVLVWRGLRRVVRREHRDLLVVGSAVNTPDGKVGLGRTTGDLPGHLECPLTIAPRGMGNRDNPGIERIGVGFDGTPEARTALDAAAMVAAALGAELCVHGVVDDRMPGRPTTDKPGRGRNATITTQTKSLSAGAVAASQASGVPARVDVTRGNPAEALRAFATSVDLLVIGSGRSAPAGRISLGATGGAVTDEAPCPVMIVPRPRDAAAV